MNSIMHIWPILLISTASAFSTANGSHVGINLEMDPSHLGSSYFNREFAQVSPAEIHVSHFIRQDIPEVCPQMCPPNTVQVKEIECFRYVSKLLSWEDSRQYCIDQGGYLAKPDLDYSNTATELSSIYQDIIGQTRIWIGASDKDSSIIWKWLTGEILSPLNPAWVLGQPGEHKSSCAQIDVMKRGNLQIRKEYCEMKRKFLCQFDLFVPVAGQTPLPMYVDSHQPAMQKL